ncbi:MAG: RluA family pseudouridine synthase [Bacilli bacterium]|nr:RluA family pseudouridine synthase [Bacilli bacterium]
MKYIYKVNESIQGNRLDKAISLLNTSLSRSYVLILLQEGMCLVNSHLEKPSYKVKINDEIIIDVPEAKPVDVKAEDIPLDIIYEDDDVLIINKPQGMVVHPSAGHQEHTLVNAILNHCDNLSGINGVLRPGIVHRIDKDTSGLIAVAKNDNSHVFLSEQLKDHTMNREYIALVKGVISENSGEINLPIGRDKHNREKMAVTTENSKEAVTYFEVLKRYKNHSLIKCKLKTGRTHQIRVHMAYIHHPVEGDPLYYGKGYNALYNQGQLLVAVKLSLVHPKSREKMSFEIELPKYFKQIIDNLE